MSRKSSLLLLHGALGSAAQLEPIAKRLEEHYTVFNYTFSGHGGKGSLDKPFAIEAFADELAAWLKEQKLGPMPVFGYSMGGYLALWLARQERYFTHILTLGTKFHWSPDSAAREVKQLQPDVIEAKVPRFAQVLSERHHPHNWKAVVDNTAQMMLDLGASPLLTEDALAQIEVPVTILLGTEDRMVSQEESRQAAASLPNASFRLLQAQPHPIEQLEPEVLIQEILNALGASKPD